MKKRSAYGSWVGIYDRLFSGGSGHAKAIAALVGCDKVDGQVLEVGCGSGRLASALHKLGHRVCASDAEIAMVNFCRRRYGRQDGLCFLPGCMNDLSRLWAQKQFDAVLCVGNTLAHARTESDVALFFAQARERLEPGGVLLLGVVNMKPILSGALQDLPILSWHGWCLERRCRPLANGRQICFRTRLVDPLGRVIMRMELLWLVLDVDGLSRYLSLCGFEVLAVLNQPGGRDVHEEDAGFYVAARKSV